MVQVMTPGSIWGQLASFCFLLSGMFGDLLVIRICLFMAYVWILVNAVTGLPAWPSVDNPGYLAVDALVWSILNLIVHGAAMLQLIWDERRIRFADEEQEQLWRFFYRRSGMGRLEFQQSLKLAKRATFEPGQVILDPAASHHTLMLLVEGLAGYTFEDAAGRTVKADMPLISGNTFDIGLLNLLGVYIGFEKGQNDVVTVRAKTACTVYTWGVDELNHLTTRCAPAVPAFWRNFALCQVGLEWHSRQWSLDEPPINGRGLRDPAGVRQGTARSSDFTDPLEE